MINSETDAPPELLTLARAAERLAVRDARTVRSLFAAQGLPLVRLGRQLRVREEDVRGLVAGSLAVAPLNAACDVPADPGRARASLAPQTMSRGRRGRKREWKERLGRNLYRFHRVSCEAAVRQEAMAPEDCDCRWMTRVRGKDVPFSARTLRDALMIAASMQEAQDADGARDVSVARLVVRKQSVTLRDFLAKEYRDNAPVLPQTLRRYEYSFNAVVPEELASTRIQSIRPIHIERFAMVTLPALDRARRRDGARRSESWITNHFTVVQALLATAVKLGYIDENPAANIQPAHPDPLQRNEREGGSPEKILTAEQYGLLLDAVAAGYTGWRQRVGCRLGFEVGLRSAEARSPLWRDVDLENGVLHVRHQWDPASGRLAETKGKRRRNLNMTPELTDELTDFRDEERRRGFGQDDDFVLRGLKPDAPMSASWVVKFMPTLQKRAGLVDATGAPLITFHGLRHSFATHAIMDNAPLKLVSEYLGHANQAITENTYWFLTKGSLARVAAAFANVAPPRKR